MFIIHESILAAGIESLREESMKVLLRPGRGDRRFPLALSHHRPRHDAIPGGWSTWILPNLPDRRPPALPLPRSSTKEKTS